MDDKDRLATNFVVPDEAHSAEIGDPLTMAGHNYFVYSNTVLPRSYGALPVKTETRFVIHLVIPDEAQSAEIGDPLTCEKSCLIR